MTRRPPEVADALSLAASANRSHASTGRRLLSMKRAALKQEALVITVNPDRKKSKKSHEDLLSSNWSSVLYWSCVNGFVLLGLYGIHKHSHSMQNDVEVVYESDVPENLWALNLIAAVKQAKCGRLHVPTVAVSTLSMAMGILQLFVLFLVVHDIDPNADPVTSKPSSPWVKSTWSINCMKWLMVTFLGVFMVREAADCRMLVMATLVTDSQRLFVPKWFLMFMAGFQYLIMIMIIWGGVTAVLSFQAVPDILYSSMSITFIAKVDEAFFTMVSHVFDIDADFTIVHSQAPSTPPPSARGMRGEYDDRGADKKSDPISVFGLVLLRFIVVFPIVLAMALISRAFHTNVMPSERIHALKDLVLHVR